jgi:hypothetical protein
MKNWRGFEESLRCVSGFEFLIQISGCELHADILRVKLRMDVCACVYICVHNYVSMYVCMYASIYVRIN